MNDTLAGQPPALDCVVVGAGAAGLTASLYLRRFHRNIRVFDAGQSRALYIDRSHNYAGFPEGVSGTELLDRMRRHLLQYGGVVTRATVDRIARSSDGLFCVATEDEKLRARFVLLCTGVEDSVPNLPGIDDVKSAGLLRQCPICDGYEYSGRRIAVIGNSEHAVREAVFLRDFSKDVRVVRQPGPHDAGLEAMALEYGVALAHAPVRTVSVEGSGLALAFDDGSTSEVDVMYSALGVRPRSQFARQLGAALDGSGNAVIDAHCRTTLEGLYAAGDVTQALDQLSVAVGHGAIAGTAIHNELRTRRRASTQDPSQSRSGAV